ncbi:MFS transporter [Mechercharimyces sp. CAU 1602]|uniref:MFS transporter n=1 Tax=Mechercharimyces sp. CAU 1602 TaxID=2973933 RepID=UPI002161C43C|nr:MFS transporter [Mechercharimyces sp. CAU 1602]MCS1350202.1 MFS transporter [Mechercharimyces sp. CAU 1602]
MRLLAHTDRLDRPAWMLLMINGLFAVATALSNTFVNVYLWKLERDYATIAQFNLVSYISMGITLYFAGKLVKKVDRVIAVRVGVALQALFYTFVLILSEQAGHYVPLLGTFLGIGIGFYWMANNILYFEITERENRDIFNGINGLLVSGAGMVAPLLSGFVITRIDHFTGYRIIFGLSLVIFLAALALTFRLSRRSAHGEYRLREVVRLARNPKKHWFWINLAMIAQGAREGIYLFLIGILVFVSTKNELVLGTFLTFSSAVSLVGFFMVGRFIKPEWRDEAILVGAVMLGLMGLPFLLSQTTWSLLLFGIGIAFFYPLYFIPLTSTVFDVIGQNEKTAALRVEYIVAREMALNVGRVGSIMLFLGWISFSVSLMHLSWFLVTLGFVQVFVWICIRRLPVFDEHERASTFK